jgi:transcriptional regulator with XRE-family HTH domain
MNLGQRLKSLRNDLGLSQEAVGAQGFVSTPGWIKIENGQRLPSDPLLNRLTKWLVHDSYMSPTAAERLREELLTLKYLLNRSDFVRLLARAHLRELRVTHPALASGSGGGSSERTTSKSRSKARPKAKKKTVARRTRPSTPVKKAKTTSKYRRGSVRRRARA